MQKTVGLRASYLARHSLGCSKFQMRNSKISSLTKSTDFPCIYSSHNVSYATFVENEHIGVRIGLSENASQCGVCVGIRSYILRFFSNSAHQAPPQRRKIRNFWRKSWKGFNISSQSPIMSIMSAVEGYCMKCKSYGPIKDGKKIVMANGRTRMAGFCSQEGCTGKISKIIA